MAYARESATIFETIAAIEACAGEPIPHYGIPLDRPVIYRWVPGDTTAIDHLATLGYTGGTPGRWLQVGTYPTVQTVGANLTNADATITLAGGTIRTLPGATLTASHILTVSPTGATLGQVITIRMIDATAWTYTVHNGGPGGTDVFIKPASESWFCDLYFDGTDWSRLRSGQQS